MLPLAVSGTLITDVNHIMIPAINRAIAVSQCSTAVSLCWPKESFIFEVLYTHWKLTLDFLRKKQRKNTMNSFFLENFISHWKKCSLRTLSSWLSFVILSAYRFAYYWRRLMFVIDYINFKFSCRISFCC